jgi:stage III sporulation protein AB
MIKLIGAALVLFASAMIGWYQALTLSTRPKQIRQLILALGRLETEISYGFTPLPTALYRMGKQLQAPLSVIFIEIADALSENDGKVTRDCWQASIQKHWVRTSMKKAEQDILYQLGFILGVTAREDQIKHLHMAMNQLQGEEDIAKQDQLRYEKMWKSLGVLAGALVVILMY